MPPEDRPAPPFPAQPKAARIPHPTILHGTTLEDDYAWLREKGSPQVLAYLQAENAYTAAAMAGTAALQKSLYDEILSHIQEDDASVPYRDGDWEYLTRTAKGSQYARYCRYPAGQPAQETVFLDVNTLAEGQPYMAIGSLAMSPSGRILAYTTDTTGFRQYTLHLRDLTTGQDIPFTHPIERVGSLVWAADSATLFFTTEDEQTKRQDRAFRLNLIPEGRHPVPPHIEGRHPDQTHMEGRHPDQTHMEGRHPDQTHIESRHPDSTHIEGRHPDPTHIEGRHPDQTHIESRHPDSTHIEGRHPDPTHMEGRHPDPTHIEGRHPERSEGSPYSAGSGTVPSVATEVFHEPDERFNLGLGRTSDRQYLLLESGSHTTNEIHYLLSDRPEDEFRLFAPRIDDEEYHIDHRAGFFYIRTNHDAKQFRLMRAPDSAALNGTSFSPSISPAQDEGAFAPQGSRSTWLELIPENKTAPLEDFDLFQKFLITSYRELGLPVLRVFDFDANDTPTAPRDIRFPDPAYEAYSEINRDFNATTFRYAYQSLVRPASVFRYDVATGTSTLLKQQTVPGGFDAAQYASARLWFPAHDGTQVPVSLVYRRDKFQQNASAPLYLYGYGSYGYALPLGFSASRLSLLDRGVVVAYAHIRGGGELGDPWHDAGKMMLKRNTFTDFIEATEFLVREGYADPARIAIEGGSAGGLLMGAVVNFALEQGKPALFRAVLSHVPFVDVMNTMLDASLPLTVAEYEEWGNPNEPEAFAYMASYSPYDNLRPGPYPAMLVKTSLNDSQVMYWEPAKYVAKLRTLKSNAAPLLLHINMEAGHGGASGRYDYLKEIAFDHAFLLRELGVEN